MNPAAPQLWGRKGADRCRGAEPAVGAHCGGGVKKLSSKSMVPDKGVLKVATWENFLRRISLSEILGTSWDFWGPALGIVKMLSGITDWYQ